MNPLAFVNKNRDLLIVCVLYVNVGVDVKSCVQDHVDLCFFLPAGCRLLCSQVA